GAPTPDLIETASDLVALSLDLLAPEGPQTIRTNEIREDTLLPTSLGGIQVAVTPTGQLATPASFTLTIYNTTLSPSTPRTPPLTRAGRSELATPGSGPLQPAVKLVGQRFLFASLGPDAVEFTEPNGFTVDQPVDSANVSTSGGHDVLEVAVPRSVVLGLSSI